MDDQQANQKQPAIDEQYLMSIMAGNKKPAPEKPEETEEQPTEKPAAKERVRNRKISDSYGDRFLSDHHMSKRGDKSIYIRPEYHERLSRIVQVIGNDSIPLYAYLDNILQHHFEQFEKAILEDFEKNYKPLF